METEDSHLLSPVRLIGAFLRWWMYFKQASIDLEHCPHGSLWFYLRWHRRPYEAYVRNIKWMC